MTTILELRDVKYFSDGMNYYKKINNKTLQKITKEEFYAKSKYNPKTIYKLLHESVYPYQINDYILLTIPKWLNQTNKKYVPADYQLANLIEYLWKKKIILFHWNQPKNKFGGVGSIDCYKNTLYGKNVIDIFIELFGENDIIIYDHVKKLDTFIEKNPNKIVILVFPKYIQIRFLQKKLEWIHKKLHITIPKKSESLKG